MTFNFITEMSNTYVLGSPTRMFQDSFVPIYYKDDEIAVEPIEDHVNNSSDKCIGEISTCSNNLEQEY